MLGHGVLNSLRQHPAGDVFQRTAFLIAWHVLPPLSLVAIALPTDDDAFLALDGRVEHRLNLLCGPAQVTFKRQSAL